MNRFESRLKSLPLVAPSESFGRPQMFAALQSGQHETAVRRVGRWSMRSEAAAVVGIAASVLLIYAAFTWQSGSSVAFAQVLEKLTRAETMSFDATIDSIQGTYPKLITHMIFLEPGKMRGDVHDPKTGHTVALVSNQAAGKALLLNFAMKTAIVSKIKRGKPASPEDTIVSHFHRLAKKASRDLGRKVVDGVESTGFEVEQDGGKLQFWADSKTGNPIRVEGEFQLPPPFGKSKMVMCNFILNEKIDPALLSVEPPQDFVVIQSPIDIDLSVTPAHLATTILRIYARRADDQLPALLNDQGASILKALKIGESKSEGEDVETIRLRGWIMQLNMILSAMKEGRDYEYYPGARLGEKDRVVFWYKDPDTGQYKIIYGDLRVENTDQSKLPQPLSEVPNEGEKHGNP